MEIEENFHIVKRGIYLGRTEVGFLESYRKMFKVFSMCVLYCVAYRSPAI